MIKIAITVRNRLGVTRKCIESILKHSKLPRQIYIYDNLTDYKLDRHFGFYYNLFKDGVIDHISFNNKNSTFNAFSKVVALNQFGKLHEQDPNKDNYEYLMFIDNDMVVTPDWDLTLLKAWGDVNRLKINDVKVIGQLPGGIRHTTALQNKIAGYDAAIGKLGGSGFWSVRPNFFSDVGYLDPKDLVNINKRHDQIYWNKLDKSTNNKPYILGLKKILSYHVGSMAGSICNTIGRGETPEGLEKIRFKNQDNTIDQMTFNEFYELVRSSEKIRKDW